MTFVQDCHETFQNVAVFGYLAKTFLENYPILYYLDLDL